VNLMGTECSVIAWLQLERKQWSSGNRETGEEVRSQLRVLHNSYFNSLVDKGEMI